MANEYAVNKADLVSVADAIRSKGGTSEALTFPGGFVSAVQAITTGGGGAASGLAYDMGEFSFEEEVTTVVAQRTDIPHNLGEVPDFICVWTDHWAGITEAPYTTNDTEIGFIWLNGMTGMTGRASSAANVTNPLVVNLTMVKNDYRVSVVTPTSAAYGVTVLPDEEVFYVPTFGAGVLYRAGVVYRYFVSKAWWAVGGGANA